MAKAGFPLGGFFRAQRSGCCICIVYFLIMVTSSHSTTRIFESRIDFNFPPRPMAPTNQIAPKLRHMTSVSRPIFMCSSRIFTPVKIEYLFPRVHCFRSNSRSAARGNIRLVENRLNGPLICDARRMQYRRRRRII